MVDVRVRQKHCLDLSGSKGQSRVALTRLSTPALKCAAIEKESPAVDEQLVHRAGDGLRRTPKGQLHH
jgi:hypothetical protein